MWQAIRYNVNSNDGCDIILFHDFQTIVNRCKWYNVNFSGGCDTSLSYDLQQFRTWWYMMIYDISKKVGIWNILVYITISNCIDITKYNLIMPKLSKFIQIEFLNI